MGLLHSFILNEFQLNQNRFKEFFLNDGEIYFFNIFQKTMASSSKLYQITSTKQLNSNLILQLFSSKKFPQLLFKLTNFKKFGANFQENLSKYGIMEFLNSWLLFLEKLTNPIFLTDQTWDDDYEFSPVSRLNQLYQVSIQY